MLYPDIILFVNIYKGTRRSRSIPNQTDAIAETRRGDDGRRRATSAPLSSLRSVGRSHAPNCPIAASSLFSIARRFRSSELACNRERLGKPSDVLYDRPGARTAAPGRGSRRAGGFLSISSRHALLPAVRLCARTLSRRAPHFIIPRQCRPRSLRHGRHGPQIVSR